ncbi:MAG TPA: FecR family protein [Dongiaceae bacterium]|nr:FecR family protein [Dongiaceae bacterium]
MLRLGKTLWAGIALISAAAVAEASSQDVGAIEKVTRNVYGTPPQASRTPQHPGDTVAFQELLETLPDSGALVRFIDGSRLTIGARSRILVDQFVFDPGSGSGNALISIASGALRFATGAMPKGKTVIDTPSATLTLRGTVVRVGVRPNGDTDLVVDEGSVDSHNKLQNTDQNVPAGSSITISSNGATGGSGTIGDVFVDRGFDATGDGTGGIEQRRDQTTGGNSRSSSGTGGGSSSGGGNSNGGGGTGGPSN